LSAVKVISGFACAVVIFAVLGIDYFLLHSHLAYFLFFLTLLVISSIELCRIAGVKSRWAIFLSMIATGVISSHAPLSVDIARESGRVCQVGIVYYYLYDNLGIWVLLVAGLVLPSLLTSQTRSRTRLRDILVPIFAAAYIGCLGAYLLRVIPYNGVFGNAISDRLRGQWRASGSYPSTIGPFWADLEMKFSHAILLWFICTTKANDILGYLLGSSIGKRQLNSVSPKKTVEGAVAGLIGGILISLLIVSLFLADHFSWYHAILFGIIVGIAAQVGDLAESLIKRLCGVKDSGNLIPGSGGALDFIDCFLFAAPAAYYFLLITG
jgi:phosphatidate cytidylyltransferase